jgi:hypothetical protein
MESPVNSNERFFRNNPEADRFAGQPFFIQKLFRGSLRVRQDFLNLEVTSLDNEHLPLEASLIVYAVAAPKMSA